MRSVSIANLVPKNDIKGLEMAFHSTFFKKVIDQLKNTRFHVDSLKPYVYRMAPNLVSAMEWMEGCINLRAKKDTVDLARSIWLPKNLKDRVVCQPSMLTHDEWVDSLFSKYCKLQNGIDAWPANILPVVEESHPNEIDRIGKWVRFKMKCCLYLQKQGKVPWASLSSK